MTLSGAKKGAKLSASRCWQLACFQDIFIYELANYAPSTRTIRNSIAMPGPGNILLPSPARHSKLLVSLGLANNFA